MVAEPISELRSVTCHRRSRSVICHPTQVSAPRHNPNQYSIYLPRRDTGLSCCWLYTEMVSLEHWVMSGLLSLRSPATDLASSQPTSITCRSSRSVSCHVFSGLALLGFPPFAMKSTIHELLRWLVWMREDV